MYEVVQKHEYQDIYRVTYSVLLIVNKYKNSNLLWHWGFTKENKNKLKKINGLKNYYRTTEDIEIDRFGNKSILSKGSIIFDESVILPTNNKDEYFYELKTTGSCFSGVGEEFTNLLDVVKEIMSKY